MVWGGKWVRVMGLWCAMGKIQSRRGMERYVRTDMYTNGEIWEVVWWMEAGGEIPFTEKT